MASAVERAARIAYDVLRDLVPVDTGNLRDNIKIEWLDGGKTARVYVDIDGAPYMPYTNEPWIADRWHGRQNPNQYWFDIAASDAINEIARRLHGKVQRDYYHKMTAANFSDAPFREIAEQGARDEQYFTRNSAWLLSEGDFGGLYQGE